MADIQVAPSSPNPLGETIAHSAVSRSKAGPSAAERRKLRNRLSQQAFRARQTLEINELKQQLTQFEGSESDRNILLARENQRLRHRLLQSEKRLCSLQATLKSIIDSMVDSRERDFSDRPDDQGLSHEDSTPPSVAQAILELPTNADFQTPEPDLDYGQNLDLTMVDLGQPTANGNSSSGALDPSLNAASHGNMEFMSGPRAEAQVAASGPMELMAPNSSNDQVLGGDMERVMNTALLELQPPTVPAPLHLNLGQFMARSNYCQHIDAFEMCARAGRLLDRHGLDLKRLTRVLSTLVSAFVKVAWPDMEAWMTYTNGSDMLAGLTAWRLEPGPDTFAAIPECFRPTPLQAAVPHPAVIDWCAFPSLRDKLIQHHSADPALGEICGDVGLAYVVQADLSELVLGAQALVVNFSVREIVHAMKNSPHWMPVDQDLAAEPAVTLPAPTLHELLHSREYAWALYRHLSIAQGGSGFRLDAGLFVKYPHLYEAGASISEGVPLRLFGSMSWPQPHPLDHVAMECYRRCASYGGHEPSRRLTLEG